MGHKSIWKSDLKEQPKGQEENTSSMQFTSEHKCENSLRQLAWPNSVDHSRLRDVTQKPLWQCHRYWNPRVCGSLRLGLLCCSGNGCYNGASKTPWPAAAAARHKQTEDLATPGLANRLCRCAAEFNRRQCYPAFPLHKSCDLLKYFQVIGHKMNFKIWVQFETKALLLVLPIGNEYTSWLWEELLSAASPMCLIWNH